MKILTSSFFNQYAQYAYQMKAENILNLNLTSENMICYKKLCIWSTFLHFVYEKILTGQFRRAPVARQCNCFQKKLHHKVLLDAKREVMMCQVSTTTHLAMGRDQKLSGHNLPPPRSDRAKTVFIVSIRLYSVKWVKYVCMLSQHCAMLVGKVSTYYIWLLGYLWTID